VERHGGPYYDNDVDSAPSSFAFDLFVGSQIFSEAIAIVSEEE
jgi:hypothetical protein